MRELAVVIHNIRSVHNVGSIFRTAECAGVHTIYLCGSTPTPIDRFGRKRKDFAKVALGADSTLRWSYMKSSEEALSALRAAGYTIVALEQHKKSVPYTTPYTAEKLALVLGEEVRGIPEGVLVQCDSIIEIPLAGKKESLNVSVAAGIALFRLVQEGT